MTTAREAFHGPKRFPAHRVGPAGRAVLLTLVVGLLASCVGGAPDPTPEELARATAQVRDAFHLQDYEFGADIGEKWARLAPDALELKAWTVANLAQGGFGGLAAKMAEEMVATNPDSPWSSFAVAAARTWTYDNPKAEEALRASEEARSGLPDLFEAVALRAEALLTFRGLDSALAFAETLSETDRDHPDLRLLEASALWLETAESPESQLDRISAALDAILRDHPDHLSANLEAANFHNYLLNDPLEAVARLEHATALTPSPWVHSRLWNGIISNAAIGDEERLARVTADVQETLAENGESPARWAGMARYLGSVGMVDLQADVERRVLEEHRGTRAEEMVLWNRYNSLAREVWEAPSPDGLGNAQKRAQLLTLLGDFIDRPRHNYPGILLKAHWNRFLLLRENPGTSPDAIEDATKELVELLETTPGPIPSVYFGLAAMTLSGRLQAHDDAMRVVDLGWDECNCGEFTVPQASGGALAEEGAGHEGPDLGLEADRARFFAVRGLILLNEGRLDEAEQELARARDLDSESFFARGVVPFSYLHSGKLMEKRAELASESGAEGEAAEFLRLADEFYRDGIRMEYYPLPSQGVPWTNPNEKALGVLYEQMHGGLDGFDEYLSALKDEGWEERKEAILAERITEPESLTPFLLETLDGTEVNSETYLGQVVIINFWGTW